MKKNIFKRGTSLLLSAVMCLSTFVGLGSTKAFAAGSEIGEALLISFPRSGDENMSNDDWGHDSKTFMNGWDQASSRYTTIYAVDSYTGDICYCIEPGTPLAAGDKLTKRDENYWDNYPSKYNKTISPDDIKLFVGRIMQYGYTGKVSLDWRSQNSADADKLAHAMATQYLIWETVVGERDADFDKVSTGGKDTIISLLKKSHPLYSRVMSYYNSMSASVQKHTKVPSFCSKAKNKAQTIELTWDGSKYTTTLTDTNGVLSNYTFSSNMSGLTFSVSGKKLTISSKTAPTGTVAITANKKNSQRKGLIVWSDGKYVPGEGIQDIVTYAQEVNDPVKGFVNLKVSYGSAKIIKTSEDGKVSGISFHISGNGVDKTMQTNSKGEIQIDNLVPGVYTVTEQSYDKYNPQEARRVTVVSGQVATVTFNNTLKRGDLQVIKSSEDNFVEGVTFHLYGTSLAGIAVDEYAVTNAKGIATFDDVLISGSSPYVVEEVNTAIRYVIPKAQNTPIKWNEVTTRSFTNILKKFAVTATKSDSEKGQPQGNATLAGAKYGIYKGEQLIDEYYTDINGQFTTKEYVCDTDWTIRELAPSEGYLIDDTVHKVGADPKLYTVEHNLTSNDVTEDVIKGNISIIKHTDNGDTQIETPEARAAFEIYLKSAGNFNNADEDERDVIVCDENGYGETKDMPYGTYTVHQTKGWDGRELMDDFDVFIAKDGQTYRFIINNRNFESYIKVVKQDKETGKTIPYAGAGFQIYDPDGNLVKMKYTYPEITEIDMFYTSADGTLVTPEKLPYGKGFSLVEVQAPYGYVLDSNPVYFDVAENNSTEEGGVTVIKVEKPNMAQKGTITVEKSGEVFFGVSVTGEENKDTIYQPLYDVEGLSGAVYEIRAAEDIITPDGTLRASKGDVVDTVTTSKNGLVKSKELYLGKYEVKEIKAPYGMILNSESHSVELVYAGQNVAVTETATSFYNERQKVEISLIKTLETNELFDIGANGETKNISFGLFAAEEIVSASGTSIPADGLIEIVSPNKDGTAVFKTDLPLGKYYVKELATDDHYILNDKTYPVTFEYAGQKTAKVELTANDGSPIENNLIYGSVSGRKVDENGQSLGRALIGLFKPDETEFTKENALMTAVSAEDGSFSFDKIPYGHWVIREIEQPTGFVLNDVVYDVEIKDDGQVVDIEIENKRIRGNVTLIKVDAEYPQNTLQGAVFEVYEDTNDNGKLDAEDKLIGTLDEKENGVYEMLNLLYGRYFVKETKAPEGFILDTDVYEVFIDTDGKTYTVENKAGVGFINEAMRGNLKIVKTSSDDNVKGFTFRITGPNGYDETFETDENGEIFIEGLRIGEYHISEVADNASASYVLPADKDATVVLGGTTVVEMHNTLRETPKTGDNSKLGLWLALAGASATGIIATAVVGFRKKKKEND